MVSEQLCRYSAEGGQGILSHLAIPPLMISLTKLTATRNIQSLVPIVCASFTASDYLTDFKETKSATMNIFRKNSFLKMVFVKVELSYVFTINLFTIVENCM